jgi:hypothetical protein
VAALPNIAPGKYNRRALIMFDIGAHYLRNAAKNLDFSRSAIAPTAYPAILI